MKKTRLLASVLLGIQLLSPKIGTAQNLGVNVATPAASLDILTYYDCPTCFSVPAHGPGTNFPSIHVVNDRLNYSPIGDLGPTKDIFSIWRRFVNSVGGTSLNSVPDLVVDPNGKVAINKAATSNILDVGGTFNADGNVTMGGTASVTSDLSVGGNATVTGNATVSTLASAGTTMVTANSSGLLGTETVPSLSISGSTLTLGNGGTISSSVSLPTGGDNLGNHTATTNLNMHGFNVNNVNSLSASSSINCVGLNAGTGNIASSGGLSVGGSASTGGLTCSSLDVAVGGISNLTGTVIVGGGSSSGFDFAVNGTTFCSSGVWDGSDKRYKTNITNVKSVSAKIFQINPYSYNFRVNEFKNKKFDDRIHYGFIAQEIEPLFPNLVKKGSDGFYAVNYIEFIPLLLQTLKEEDAELQDLKTKVSDLEIKLNSLQQSTSDLGTHNATSTLSSKSTLAQNVPNPFNRETTIGYNIIGSFSQAYIGIYDLNGRELRKVTVQPNTNSVVVPAGTLTPGMYIYSLLVDNNLIDTKKMVVE